MIVGCVDSLPQAVASGGSLHSGGDNAFPLRLCEASSNGRPDTALPVMALGTQVTRAIDTATTGSCFKVPCVMTSVSRFTTCMSILIVFAVNVACCHYSNLVSDLKAVSIIMSVMKKA